MSRIDRRLVAGLVVLVATLAVPYALLGPNFVLDDWYLLRNARFDGALAGGGRDITLARPGQWVVYVLEFGILGRHPLPIYLVQVAVRATVVVALFALFRHYLDEGWAAGLAALWALFPNATALEVWATGLNITVSLLLLVLGALGLSRAAESRRESLLAPALLAASVLTYEATMPAAGAVVLVVPLLKRHFRWRQVLVGWGALAATGLWLALNWYPGKHVTQGADLSPVVGAHFGWGLFPRGPVAGAASLVALVLVAVTAGRVALPGFRSSAGAADWLVVAGLAAIAAGVVPFVRYVYTPLGAGDRVTVVSSVGAAMVLTGFAMHAARWRPALVAGALVVVVSTTLVRVERADVYAAAGAHMLDLLDALSATFPRAPGVVVVGPEPWVYRNVAGVIDHSHLEAAIQLEMGDRSLRAVLTRSEAAFLDAPPGARFDLRRLRTYPPPRGLRFPDLAA